MLTFGSFESLFLFLILWDCTLHAHMRVHPELIYMIAWYCGCVFVPMFTAEVETSAVNPICDCE